MTYDKPCGTILVVDDNLDICAFAKRFLETAGWTVVTAADGAEGSDSTKSINRELCYCSPMW
jgi:DNA-binding response OmpR family regulator